MALNAHIPRDSQGNIQVQTLKVPVTIRCPRCEKIRAEIIGTYALFKCRGCGWWVELEFKNGKWEDQTFKKRP
jgi:phage FluMu protein Com